MRKLLILLLILLALPVEVMAFSNNEQYYRNSDIQFYDPSYNPLGFRGVGNCKSLLSPTISDPSRVASAIDTYINDLFPNSPMNGMGNLFVSGSERAGVNPLFLAAIARKETGFGSDGNRNITEANNVFNRTATSSQPNVQYEDSNRLWYFYESIELSLDGQGEEDHPTYMRRRFYEQGGVSSLEEVMNLYAPPSENDTDLYVDQMNQWIDEMVDLADDAIDCSGFVIGDVECPPNLGSPSTENFGYFKMPDSVDGTYTFGANTPERQRYGSRQLVCVLYTVASAYKSIYGDQSTVKINDLNASGHNTHNRGIAVDLNAIGDIEAANHLRSPEKYSPEATVDLGILFVQTGVTQNIWWCEKGARHGDTDGDDGSTQAIKEYADNNGYNNLNIKCIWGSEDRGYNTGNGHRDHFHVDILDQFQGSYHEP